MAHFCSRPVTPMSVSLSHTPATGARSHARPTSRAGEVERTGTGTGAARARRRGAAWQGRETGRRMFRQRARPRGSKVCWCARGVGVSECVVVRQGGVCVRREGLGGGGGARE